MRNRMEKNCTFSNEIAGNILNVLQVQVTASLLVVLVMTVLYMLFVKNGLKELPGPIGLPFFGYWPFLTKDPHVVLNRLAKKYGNVFGIYLGQKYAVVCNDYEAVKDALGKTESITRPNGLFRGIPFGMGFGSSNVHDWSAQRRFSVKGMKDVGFGAGPQWEELLQEEVGEVVSRIQSCQGQSTDVDTVLAGSFTNNAMVTLFGRRLPCDEVRRIEESMAIALAQHPALDPCFFLPSIVNSLFLPQKSTDRIKEFSDYVQKCIEEKLEIKVLLEQKSFFTSYLEKIQENKRMRLGNNFTDASLLRNIRTLLFGSSGKATAFQWLLVAMAEHPEKQLKVHQELDAVLGKDRVLTRYADRTSVPYTFAAILESMRWRTIMYIDVLRVFSEDTTLQGYKITKGTLLVANFWAVHNDTRYWNDPELFEPERFLTEDKKSIIFQPESFVPFSFGRRNCPGQRIALSVILLYFATIMQKFKVLPEEGAPRVKEQFIGANCTAVSRSLDQGQTRGVRFRFIARD